MQEEGSRVYVEGVVVSTRRDAKSGPYFMVQLPGAATAVPVLESALSSAPSREFREREIDLDSRRGTFQRRFRELRQRANMSQREIALQIGVRQGAIWQWEHGKTFPSYNNLMKICHVLSVTANDLLEEKH